MCSRGGPSLRDGGSNILSQFVCDIVAHSSLGRKLVAFMSIEVYVEYLAIHKNKRVGLTFVC